MLRSHKALFSFLVICAACILFSDKVLTYFFVSISTAEQKISELAFVILAGSVMCLLSNNRHRIQAGRKEQYLAELLEKEQKLENAYQKIKTFNETLRQIAWSNSHEMRKPVCSILSLVSLLQHSDNDRERRQYLNLLETAASELDEVLKQNEKMTEVETETTHEAI
jgi:signal transduction histidine kinase